MGRRGSSCWGVFFLVGPVGVDESFFDELPLRSMNDIRIFWKWSYLH